MMVPEKLCSRCSTCKPLDHFYKSKNGAQGVKSHCKACQSILNKAFYSKNAEAEKLRAKQWREANPDTHRQATKRWREANADRHKEMTRAWREVNAEHVKAERKANHHNNLDRELARNREWKRNNRHMVRAYDSKRRVAEKRATPSWASQEKILEFYFAADFLGMVTGAWHHVDHVVPLQSKVVCGLHCETNLQVLPARENFSKGNRHWPDMP